jgi:hypothetical protein
MQQQINDGKTSRSVARISQLLTFIQVKRSQEYFTQAKIDSVDLISDINREVERLYQQIVDFSSGLADNHEYYQFLMNNTDEAEKFDEEADFLEWLIPVWSNERGRSFSQEKPIDEFYKELEFLILWKLLVDCVDANEFVRSRVTKMRAIIRRYSNMPALWLYLCKISGEEIKSAYTF